MMNQKKTDSGGSQNSTADFINTFAIFSFFVFVGILNFYPAILKFIQ